jgi:NADPH-dependent ferric siderophore reductase
MLFSRESVRHPMALRRLRVSAVRQLVPSMVRVTFAGEEPEGFASLGPTDHVKVFFPDPATGVLTTPEVSPDGIRRPTDGVILSRDYTPRASRANELDIDFVVHGDEGPATAWASRTAVGDELGVAGPRGSRLVPPDLGRLLVIADETALPTTARWLELLPTSVPVTAIFDVADDTVEAYFDDVDTDRLDAEWLYREDGPGQLEEALRSLGPIADDTFVFLAGEAGALVPLRRYLRHELELPAAQVSASGYWRRGVINLDHHAPLDPSDPD